MAEFTEESIIQIFNEERKKLLKEVQERVEKRKALMEADQVKDYNFYKRRSIGQ